MFRKFMLIYLVLLLAESYAAFNVNVMDDKMPLSSYNQTFSSPDGMISLTVPPNWYNDEQTAKEQERELCLNNSLSLWIDVYYIEDVTAKEFTDYLMDYYGNDMISEVKMVVINGALGAMFEYRFISTASESTKALFHGYEYIIGVPGGVVELDAYRSFDNVDTDETPTDKELLTFMSIAESLKVVKTSEL